MGGGGGIASKVFAMAVDPGGLVYKSSDKSTLALQAQHDTLGIGAKTQVKMNKAEEEMNAQVREAQIQADANSAAQSQAASDAQAALAQQQAANEAQLAKMRQEAEAQLQATKRANEISQANSIRANAKASKKQISRGGSLLSGGEAGIKSLLAQADATGLPQGQSLLTTKLGV